ncbi:sensor histidine kinase [Pontibacter sp. HSC-14F20]|uniref:sensor histidine kinase n=1 Tax=Pontibacter sp. HSC-14F20 TaxID=2864136 RepID=UPI001C72CC5A|nr:histidine kinase [Pontibacter sp. HSC-14F20]MBX0335343.1 sensor histidine kinase [Pontibacter sp. HSC-14F20]
MFCFLLLLLKLPLQGNLLDPAFPLFVLAMLTIVATNHYVIAYGLVRFVQPRNWGILVGLLLVLYTFSAISSILSIALLAGLFPENAVFQALSSRYELRGIADLFTLSTFTWVMSFVFPFCMFTLFIKFYKSNQDAARKNLYLQKVNSELELNFLRSQINPHFFFNTLNSLYSLVFDNERAAKIVLDLSDIMRFSLYEAKGERIPIEREIKFLSDYIGLEAMRHDSRVLIEYDFDLNGHERLELPPLLLVNFIENAFKHGIHNTIEKAWVEISLQCQDGVLFFKVSNSRPTHGRAREKGDSGIGLQNVKRRLNILYPERHELMIREEVSTFHVVLQIQMK